MNTFSSTLELENLQGFDKGVPVVTSSSKYLIIKFLLIAAIICGVFYWIYTLINRSEDTVSEKMKFKKSDDEANEYFE